MMRRVGLKVAGAARGGVRACERGREHERAGSTSGAGLEPGDRLRSGSERTRSGFLGFTPDSASFSGHSSRISDHISLIPPS
jgi:hypothetical protein